MVLDAVEVAGVEVSAFRVVHPGYLVFFFGGLRAGAEPGVEVVADGCHFLVEFGALFEGSGEDVAVDAEDCFVDSGLDLVELDDVDEGLDVGPLGFVDFGGFLVC